MFCSCIQPIPCIHQHFFSNCYIICSILRTLHKTGITAPDYYRPKLIRFIVSKQITAFDVALNAAHSSSPFKFNRYFTTQKKSDMYFPFRIKSGNSQMHICALYHFSFRTPMFCSYRYLLLSKAMLVAEILELLLPNIESVLLQETSTAKHSACACGECRENVEERNIPCVCDQYSDHAFKEWSKCLGVSAQYRPRPAFVVCFRQRN